MPRQAKERLRPYQEALVVEIMAALDPHGSVLLQLPTGGGKTRIATEIVRRCKSYGRTVWFVCHRKEILSQTSAAFAVAGIEHGLVKAGSKVEGEYAVWVCSVDALARRLAQMEPPDVMVWDEAHHIVARRWAEMKVAFREAHHLGLTATPDRLDGTGLRGSFNHLICGPDTRTLIDEGHLSPYRLFGPTIPDLRRARTKMGDYDRGDLEEEMSKPVLVGDVVDHYKRLAPNARAIAFAISVKASQAVVERFRAAGVPAQHVDAKTPPAERDAAVAALAAGTIKVLSNVEVFTEGFDLPAIDAVILLRPTKSLAMYRQMVGRGLRKAPGKAATVILDHSGLVHEHGLPCDHIEWTLDGFSRPPEEKDGEGKPRLRRCPECSAIHATAAECVECGHVYVPEDRTIEEVYGYLKPHTKPILPAGFESQTDFGRRIGYTSTSIRNFLARGMPSGPNNSVNVIDALTWINNQTNIRRQEFGKHPGFETQADFAKRIGETISMLTSLKKRGMPYDKINGIEIERALSWIGENGIKRKRRITTENSGLESRSAFQRRADLSLYVLNRAIKNGLPINSDNNIPFKEAIDWIEKNPLPRGWRKKSGEPDFLTESAFAVSVGTTYTTLQKYKNPSFPLSKDGRVEVKSGKQWCIEHLPFSEPYREARQAIKISVLAKAAGVSYGRMHSLIKLGMPIISTGLVNAKQVLEWIVRYQDSQIKKHGKKDWRCLIDVNFDGIRKLVELDR